MRGVNHDRKYMKLIQQLTSKQGDKGHIFRANREVISYAALLGYREGNRERLPTKAKKEHTPWYDFESGHSTDYIFMVALAAAKDISILNQNSDESQAPKNQKDMVALFEEYANRGLEILQNWMNKHPESPTQAIIEGLKEAGYLPDTINQGKSAKNEDDTDKDIKF